MFKKYLLVFGSVTVFATSLGYRIFNFFKPSIESILKIEGHKTIFDSEKPKFNKWVKLYSYFKEDLIKEEISPIGDISDKERAFVFKHWCAKTLKSNLDALLNKAKKYCTMTLGIYALEQEGVELIEDLKAIRKKRTEWAPAFKKNKDAIIKSKLLKGISNNKQDMQWERFRDWCKANAKESYIPKNYGIAVYFSSWCVKPIEISKK